MSTIVAEERAMNKLKGRADSPNALHHDSDTHSLHLSSDGDVSIVRVKRDSDF